MAIVKKCDICGVLYEPYNESCNPKNTNGIMFLNIDTQEKYFGHKLYDCCPSCMESIRNLIELLKSSTEKKEKKE